MTIEEMQRRKRELGLTYEAISERSGLPLPTVQKVLGGITKSPRYDTLQALEKVLGPEGRPGGISCGEAASGAVLLQDPPAAYGSYISGTSARSCTESYPLLPYKRQGEYTAEDRERLPEDVRTELIDGVLYDLAAPRNIHQVIVAELIAQLRRCIEEHGEDCYVLMAPSDVWLDRTGRTVVQPDIYVVCDYSMLCAEGYTRGAPPLVIEVTSPSTRGKDMLLKAYKYSRAGVREYWIVDPEKKKVIVYRYDRDSDGTEHEDYGFDSPVPVGVSDGRCSVDFRKVGDVLRKLGMRADLSEK